MKRPILIVGLVAAFLTAAFVQENLARPKVPLMFDEGAQLGSAFPEVTHWPEPVMQVGTRPHVLPGE